MEDERVVATFAIYFSHATSSISSDHPGASRRYREASWNWPSSFSRRKREILALSSDDERERDGTLKP